MNDYYNYTSYVCAITLKDCTFMEMDVKVLLIVVSNANHAYAK